MHVNRLPRRRSVATGGEAPGQHAQTGLGHVELVVGATFAHVKQSFSRVHVDDVDC